MALSVSDGRLTIDPAADYDGGFLVVVHATDGMADTSDSFAVYRQGARPPGRSRTNGVSRQTIYSNQKPNGSQPPHFQSIYWTL